MKHPVIIGYGNPLREDDGLGWRAADLLASQHDFKDAEIIQRHQLTPELAVSLEDAAPVVFMDAAMDIAPGEVCCDRLEVRATNGMSHQLEPSQLLGLAHDLYGSNPAAYLIRGGVFQTGLGDKLSDVGHRCAEEMAETAIKLLDTLQSDTPVR